MIAEADRWRKRYAAELTQEMASHPGQPCNATIASAFVRLLHAESEYEVLGGAPPQSPVLKRALAACEDLPSHDEKQSGPRGASRPPQE